MQKVSFRYVQFEENLMSQKDLNQDIVDTEPI